MKQFFAVFAVIALVLSFASPAYAKTIKVKSYYKPSIHKYVPTHYKTSPNKTKFDNFSTKGNYNPYTGKVGTKKAY